MLYYFCLISCCVKVYYRKCFVENCMWLVSSCRHPIADHYSLTLEIAKDRATEASPVLCTRQMYNLGQCPDDVFANEHFVKRSLNDPCHQMVSQSVRFLSDHSRFLTVYGLVLSISPVLDSIIVGMKGCTLLQSRYLSS